LPRASASRRRSSARHEPLRAAKPLGSASVSCRRITSMSPASPSSSGRLRPSSTGSTSIIATFAFSANVGGLP
jgi:hypothetical protein